MAEPGDGDAHMGVACGGHAVEYGTGDGLVAPRGFGAYAVVVSVELIAEVPAQTEAGGIVGGSGDCLLVGHGLRLVRASHGTECKEKSEKVEAVFFHDMQIYDEKGTAAIWKCLFRGMICCIFVSEVLSP